ncbi:alpha/beta hydrolase [Guptibacillus algicola]|uniref:alpha/beta hydrolase n=1 Tax=Guptibacillus algicola TaxID=225844 RepID=UPI001CD71C2E|nr:alpha/beta hydrolase-fold protein [Alkalihalobacillus algicola]MCA0988676.1 alpha/beta hydrolase [Alkalihalobacillus algicola]
MMNVFSLYIPVFEEERKIRIYLPNDYHETLERYPVIYMHDGQNVFDDDDAVGGRSLRLRELLEHERIQAIVVAIDSGERRMSEYCPFPTGEISKELTATEPMTDVKGKEYLDFIVSDLKPYIDRTYRTLKQSTLAGISLGGLLTVYAICRYPHVFTRGAAISSAFFRNQEEIERFIGEADLSNVEKLYLDCGTVESGDRRVDRVFYETNQGINMLLSEKVTEVEFNTVQGGAHTYEAFSERIGRVVTFLMS